MSFIIIMANKNVIFFKLVTHGVQTKMFLTHWGNKMLNEAQSKKAFMGQTFHFTKNVISGAIRTN